MHPLDSYFRDSLTADLSDSGAAIAAPESDKSAWWWGLFEAQATSRHLDFVARELQQEGRGFYTIGSAGHESNAMVAMAARPSDPALLHYRSGGFYVARAQQVVGSTPIRDILQGLMGLADEPIAGGRHKVFGHPDLAVIPQTSTIASHLPRAVGLSIALHRAHRLGVDCEWPSDAVVVCSFGDASANHSTAAGAINTALATAFRGLPVPILFVCEDNGFGISVPTPAGWIEAAYGSRPGLAYVAADGSDPANAWPAILKAIDFVREQRRPASPPPDRPLRRPCRQRCRDQLSETARYSVRTMPATHCWLPRRVCARWGPARLTSSRATTTFAPRSTAKWTGSGTIDDSARRRR